MAYGATADFGFNAIEDTLSIRDLHVWIIHLIGVGYKELTRVVESLEQKLTGVETARVIRELLA